MPLFGLSATGKLFSKEHPGWHDPALRQGETPLNRDEKTGFGYHNASAWWWPIVSLQALILSPNLVWLVISAAMYVAVPYHLDRADGLGPKDGWSWAWMAPRFYLNCGVTMLYVSYWYFSLYHWGYAERKFKVGAAPSLGRMVHNSWYTFLGAFQWSVWEVVFMRLWATGALPYVTDVAALSNSLLLAKMLFWVAAVPVFREFHFYWAHRMLHFRVLYRFVHSLHHRNVDPEPFSGLCMHPVEHLYYLATVLPSVVFTLSPFHFLWNGMHAVISPAAGHSGWEDHWQSDQHHYIHHAKFECNYGGGGIPVDAFFGTLRDTLTGKDSTYKGQAGGSNDDTFYIKEAGAAETEFKFQSKIKTHADYMKGVEYSMPKLATLNPTPRLPDGLYMTGVVAIFSALYCALACHGGDLYSTDATVLGRPVPCPALRLGPLDHRTTVPLLVAWGPVVWGAVLNFILRDKYQMTWPFQKDPALRTLAHLAIGTVFCQLVVFQSLAMYFGSEYTLPTPVLSGR